jgi:hypothetical protein
MSRGWELEAEVIHAGIGDSMEGEGRDCILHRGRSGEGYGRHRHRHSWVSNLLDSGNRGWHIFPISPRYFGSPVPTLVRSWSADVVPAAVAR